MHPRPTNGVKKEDLVLWKSPLKTSLFAAYQFTYLIRRCLHRYVSHMESYVIYQMSNMCMSFILSTACDSIQD